MVVTLLVSLFFVILTSFQWSSCTCFVYRTWLLVTIHSHWLQILTELLLLSRLIQSLMIVLWQAVHCAKEKYWLKYKSMSCKALSSSLRMCQCKLWVLFINVGEWQLGFVCWFHWSCLWHIVKALMRCTYGLHQIRFSLFSVTAALRPSSLSFVKECFLHFTVVLAFTFTVSISECRWQHAIMDWPKVNEVSWQSEKFLNPWKALYVTDFERCSHVFGL